MSSPEPAPPPSPQWRLLRQLSLLFLLAISLTLGLALWLRSEGNHSILMRVFFSDAVLGLAAGFFARLLLRRHHWLLRFLAALAALTVSMNILGFFTGWRIGIALVYGRHSVDWIGLAQLVTAALTALLALHAWPRPQPIVVAPPPAAPAPSQAPPPRRRRRVRPAAGRTSRPRVRGSEKPVLKRPTSRIRRGRVFRRRPKLRLSAVEEHRCPYCLEIVRSDDPRGVVECDICHSLHHADCWAITGACQVPHYNT